MVPPAPHGGHIHGPGNFCTLGGDHVVMRCVDALDLLSARLDGEVSASEVAALDAHTRGCARCRAEAQRMAALHSRLRVRPAEQVPDLTASILGHLPEPRRRRQLLPVLDASAMTLLVVALSQLLLSLPLLFTGSGSSAVHASRELGAFNVAFAVGLLVVVWQPERAAGLLPMAAALAGAMVLTGVADLVSGVAAPVAEVHHLLELVGLGGLWVVARRTPRRSTSRAFAA